MKKIKITGLPKMVYGGRAFNQVAPNAIPNHMNEAPLKVNDTLKSVPREVANLEAEKGETAFIPNLNGMSAHYKIGGKRHSEGGTPLNLPDDSFIFSDTRSMTLKDKDLLQQFGESKPKTYAEIAKKYDINKYRKVLADKDSDVIEKKTAEKMIENYNMMLGKLALTQESQKGFPQGIPFIAQPYMMMNNINPEDILPQQKQEQEQAPQQEQEMSAEMPPQMPQARYGGMRAVRIKGLPRYQDGAGVLSPEAWDAMVREKASAEERAAREALLELYNSAALKQVQDQSRAAVDKKTQSKSTSGSSNSKSANSKGYNPDRSRAETYDYVQAFLDAYVKAAESGAFVPELPSTYTADGNTDVRSRQATQSLMSGQANVYGDPEVLNEADFKKRHAWYFKNKPKWDKNNPADVKDFQTSYNVKAKEYGLPEYFTLDGPKGTILDGLFGEHTWSAPGFNTPAKKPVVATEKSKTDVTPLEEIDVEAPPVYNPFEYYPQDTLNLATAMAGQIPDMKTFYAPVQLQGWDPAYIKEDYSPIMEAANIATQGVTSFGTRQGADASLSKIQGQASRSAADHNLQVANMNIGIYNDAEKYNSQVAAKNIEYNNALKMADFDARQLYAADRLKAKNKKRAEVANLFNTRLTNATDTYNLNLTSPYFKIFPGSGGAAVLTNPKMLEPNKDAYAFQSIREFNLWKEAYPGLSDEAILNYLARSKGAGQVPENQYYNPYDVSVGPYGGGQ